jgi:hypothetical protein
MFQCSDKEFSQIDPCDIFCSKVKKDCLENRSFPCLGSQVFDSKGIAARFLRYRVR